MISRGKGRTPSLHSRRIPPRLDHKSFLVSCPVALLGKKLSSVVLVENFLKIEACCAFVLTQKLTRGDGLESAMRKCKKFNTDKIDNLKRFIFRTVLEMFHKSLNCVAFRTLISQIINYAKTTYCNCHPNI